MRLISITALVFRFVENLKKNQLKINKGTSNLKPFDNTGGANLWIRFPQQDIIKIDNYKQLKTDWNLYFFEQNVTLRKERVLE